MLSFHHPELNETVLIIMALYGYARVSASGSSRTGRSELRLLLEFLRPGDTLMVTRVDRLAHSIKDLQDIVYALNQ